jgi:AcrR family transcriptional regulator
MKHLDEITVKELCEDVQICEATFFNYFRKKTDLLHYARLAAGPDAGLRFIEAIFEHTGKQLANHPRLMLELIAHMASDPHGRCEDRPELSVAERLHAVPACQGLESAAELGLPHLFGPALARAVAAQELPARVDRDAAVLALLSVFFGVPLWLGTHCAERISRGYRDQLKVLWAGLRAAE